MKEVNCQITLLIFVIAMIIITLLEAKRDFTIIVQKLDIKVYDWDLVQSEHHYVYNQKVIYVDFTITKNVSDFDLKISLDMIKKDNRRMNVLKMDTNGCESLQTAHNKMNFLKVIFREIFRVSNIPKKCPFYANKKYSISNYTVKDDDYPPIFPLLEWELKIGLLFEKRLKADATITGRIRKL